MKTILLEVFLILALAEINPIAAMLPHNNTFVPMDGAITQCRQIGVILLETNIDCDENVNISDTFIYIFGYGWSMLCIMYCSLMDDSHSVSALTKSPCLANSSRVKRYNAFLELDKFFQ